LNIGAQFQTFLYAMTLWHHNCFKNCTAS